MSVHPFGFCLSLLLSSLPPRQSPVEMAASALSGKPRILCLHGKSQSGSLFSQKIGGARRKLARVYDLEFLDGPIVLRELEDGIDGSGDRGDGGGEGGRDLADARAWFLRDDDGKHVHVREAFEYIREHTEGKRYDALIGFSQGERPVILIFPFIAFIKSVTQSCER